ncbi:Hpt domain-containing protein [Nonlabens sp.]|uniref:Hpt domain-containing protein n=1 Tax=Nonlabens sp. TaxID=1888209 RepID=UPI0025F8ECD2|nr:Hpt domain-containing protein [Nonlabens sp.]
MKKVTYDLSQIIELSDNDPDFIKLMVGIFIQEMTVDLDRLELAVTEKDRENVQRYAHKIRPSLEMFGLSGYHNALVLEKWAKSAAMKDISADFKHLSQELQETLIQLKRDF